MKKKNSKKPAKSYVVVLKQVLNHIPRKIVNECAHTSGAEKHARTFSVYSHLVSLLYAQISKSMSLHDVCDSLELKSATLYRIGATPPKRNTLSNANKSRPAEFAEKLLWKTLEHLGRQSPSFLTGLSCKGYLRRFKVRIQALDSSVIKLVANSMDWAKHRRRKAAAKMHLRLDLRTFLPSFIIVGKGKQSDAARAREMCAGLKDGEIVLFDRAYIDYAHLYDLANRGVQWVSRAKKSMVYKVIESKTSCSEKILEDEVIEVTVPKTEQPLRMRRVKAMVTIDGKDREMVFVTNNEVWSAWTVCELYRARWEIEVFFKQVKQTLKLSNFLGYCENAVKWQIYTALLLYVLLRYEAYRSQWKGSFIRLFGIVRATRWEKVDLEKLLKSYGTASAQARPPPGPTRTYYTGFLPGFERI